MDGSIEKLGARVRAHDEDFSLRIERLEAEVTSLKDEAGGLGRGSGQDTEMDPC